MGVRLCWCMNVLSPLCYLLSLVWGNHTTLLCNTLHCSVFTGLLEKKKKSKSSGNHAFVCLAETEIIPGRSWSYFLLWLCVTACRGKSLMGICEQPCPDWVLAELRSSIFLSWVILEMQINLAPGRARVNHCQPSGKFTADFLLLFHRII